MKGLTLWLVQRLTALVILGYTMFLTLYVLKYWHTIDYLAWTALHAHIGMRIASTLVLVSVLWHAFIGIWTVATDYIHAVFIRSMVEVLSFFALLSWAIWGISMVWGVV